MKDGLGSPYFKVYFEGKELLHAFVRLRYVHAEETDDSSEISIETDDDTILDNPEFNDKAEWRLVWGYKGDDKTFDIKAYVEDVVPEYDKDGVKIVITLHDKAKQLKKVKGTSTYQSATLAGVATKVGREQKMNVKIQNLKLPDTGLRIVKESDYKKLQGDPAKVRQELREIKGIEYSGNSSSREALDKQLNTPWVDSKGTQHKEIEEFILYDADGDASTKGTITNPFGVSVKATGNNINTSSSRIGGDNDPQGLSYTFNKTPGERAAAQRQEIRDKHPWLNPKPNFKDPELQKKFVQASPVARQAIESGKLDPTRVGEYMERVWLMRLHKGIVQGNTTHAAFLRTLSKKERGGNWIVTGHGNDLIVRRRNFNQKPIALYSYKSDTNGFSTFKPETRNKAKSPAATSVSYSGIDRATKKTFSGRITAQDIKKEVKIGGGVMPAYKGSTYESFGADVYKISGPLSPETNLDRLRNSLKTPYPFSGNAQGPIAPAHNYFPGGVNQITPTLPGEDNQVGDENIINNQSIHYNYPSESIEEAGESAENKHQRAQAELNPGSLVVVGNTSLISGKMVTVETKAQKNTGNYYMTKVVHEMLQSAAYVCTAELIRNSGGKSYKLSSTRQFLKGSDKYINQKVSDRSPYNNTRKSVRTKFE